MSNVPTNLIPTKITQLPEYTGDSTLGYMPYVLAGRTYKVQFANIAAVGAVPSTRAIYTGTGLTGGGDLSQDRTIAIANGGVGYSQLAPSGVVAGVYGSGAAVPILSIDDTGRVTSASTAPLTITGYVPDSRTITAGAGLSGGGTLAADRTLSVSFSAATPEPLGLASAGSSDTSARGDHIHPAVDLGDANQTQGALPLGRGGTGDALSPVAGAVVYSTGTKFALTDLGIAGQILTSDGTGMPYWATVTGTGTVTDVSVVTANGFAGTVADPASTPAITLKTTVTGMVKGNGTALSAASAGSDYVAPGAYTSSGLTMASSRLLGRTTAGTGSAEEITVGTGLSLSVGALTNSAPDQVVTLTAGAGISISGTYPSFTISASGTGTVTSVAASGGTTGLTFSGSPITTSGTLTLGGTLAITNGGTGATTAGDARTNLSAAKSGANSDITSMSGITGAIGTATYIDFNTGATVTDAAGRIWFDGQSTLNIGMSASVTGHAMEDQYYYVKASGAITKGQLVMFTGTVGASGTPTGAPATGLGVNDGHLVMGIAAESIALNGFGLIQAFGPLRGFNTSGSPYGETWADGDLLYYNSAYAGGLTKTQPTAPGLRSPLAAVLTAASGGSGSVLIRISEGSVLGGTDSNVYVNGLANGDLLQYSSGNSRWQNTANTSVTVGAATNLSGGAANRIAYQTGAGATSFITAPSVANTFLEWSGSAFQWSANPLGTVTSVDVSGGTTGLSFSGGPVTTSGTITMAGTLAATNGGTGQTGYAVGDLLYASTTTALSKLADVATGNALISGGVGVAPSYGKIGLTTHVSGTLAIANGGTNGSATPTAGAVPYGTGTAYAFTAAGTAGQVLLSNGASAPTFGGIDGGTF